MIDHLEQVRSGLATRYAIQRELGRGGMATVFLTRDLKHDRLVALKVLRAPSANEQEAERFLREIRITAALQHPHILTLLDSGEVGGYLYYVTPYIEGESLRHRLILERQLTVEAALELTRQVANAIDYAHQHGVVHRDIKPENILVSGGYAIVSDFGIAHATDITLFAHTLHEPVGTHAYMSPEQILGTNDVDGRSDVYALACTLFEMLAGRTPFVGPTPESIAEQQVSAPPPSILSIRPLVAPEIDVAISRALAKTPADRFRTARDFADALLPAQAFMHTPTPPSGIAWTPTTQTPPVQAVSKQRRRRWFAAAGVALVVLALAAAVALWRPRTRAAAADDDSARFTGSVAVLPFDNLGGGSETQYFADGMTEEIIAQLAALPDLKIISRTSVAVLKASGMTIPRIADTLGVMHVLEGSVRRVGNRVRVVAQLIEARSDAHLWSQTFDRELTDVFSVQDEIARNVSLALSATFRDGDAQLLHPRPRNPAAYDAYLQGVHLMRQLDPASWRASIDMLRQAIAYDSLFAPAYVAFAEALSNATIFAEPGTVDAYTVYAAAMKLGDHAVVLDSSFAEGYAVRAVARLSTGARPHSVLADVERAARLRPNAAGSHAYYAIVLSMLDRYEEALVEVERAAQLAPVEPGIRLAYSAVAAGGRRWDIVLREARRARSMGAPLNLGEAYEAVALLRLGRTEECLKLDLGVWVSLRSLCLHSAGRVAEAVALVDSLAGAPMRDDEWVTPMGLSFYYAWTSNAPKWAEWFERGVAISPDVNFDQLFDSDLFDPIREKPQFKRTVARAQATVRSRFNRVLSGMSLHQALYGVVR